MCPSSPRPASDFESLSIEEIGTPVEPEAGESSVPRR